MAVPGGRVGGFSVRVFLVQRKRSRGAGKGPVLAAARRTAFLPEAVRTEVKRGRTMAVLFVLRDN